MEERRSKSKANFESFVSDGVLASIFAMMEVGDFAKICRVCKWWNRVASSGKWIPSTSNSFGT
jgi:hypothetical protein